MIPKLNKGGKYIKFSKNDNFNNKI